MHPDPMFRALELAARGRRRAAPNPMVGAVVVSAEGQIVGEGFHEHCGGPHAESQALQAAGEAARDATLHVTLEPCNHHGRTPPCTEAILAAGVRRVVYGLEDPNPLVRGTGARRLVDAGVEVEHSEHGHACALANRAYLTRVRENRPLVVAKWAMSLDGRIATATGESQWITGDEARADVHSARDMACAILVGAGTVRADDPLLTCRGVEGGRDPVRVVLDGRLAISTESRLVATARSTPTVVLTSAAAPGERAQRLRDAGVEVLLCGDDPRLDLRAALAALAEREITYLLVEGGADTLGGFLDACLVDEVRCYLGAKLIGGASAPPAIAGGGVQRLAEALELEDIQTRQLGADLLVTARTPFS